MLRAGLVNVATVSRCLLITFVVAVLAKVAPSTKLVGFYEKWIPLSDQLGCYKYTVEPHLADTPEMWPSKIMCSVRNAISTDLHINRPPEMRTPRYSVKQILGLAPPPIQFGTNFVDSLVQQTARTGG